MIYILLFFLEIFILWRLSRQVNSRFISTLPTRAFAVIFLPGTFIHELSHFIMAKLLFVRVGKFTISPKVYEKEIILGSVSIEKKDIVRRVIIGAAPVFFGAVIIFSIIYFSVERNLYRDWKATLLISYVVFVIGNTMFSSKKDMEGAWKVGLSSVFIFIIFYVLGVRVSLNLESAIFTRFIEIIKLANIYLLAPIAIDAVILWAISLKRR